MVRRPLREDVPERPTQSASGRARNVIVAHGVHPGQTIELAHGEKATLSEVEADRRQPQSVALSRVEQRIPRFSADGHVVPHSVIGDPDEYEELRLAHTRGALAELDQIPHPPPPEVAHRKRPSQQWGWGGGRGSSADAKPGPRSRRISERIADEKLANEQRTWEKWDHRWHSTQARLAEQFGKPVDKLIFNSTEEYNSRVRFLDALERTNPPALDENKRFMMAVRDANIYYAPIGVRQKNSNSAQLYCGVRVPTTKDITKGGRVQSPGAKRRNKYDGYVRPNQKRLSLKALSLSLRWSSNPAKHPPRTPSPTKLPAIARGTIGAKPVEQIVSNANQVSPETALQREKNIATALHGTPADVKRTMGTTRRHTIREGKLKLLSEVQMHDQKYAAESLEGGFSAELAEARKQEDARRRQQGSMHSLVPSPRRQGTGMIVQHDRGMGLLPTLGEIVQLEVRSRRAPTKTSPQPLTPAPRPNPLAPSPPRPLAPSPPKLTRGEGYPKGMAPAGVPYAGRPGWLAGRCATHGHTPGPWSAGPGRYRLQITNPSQPGCGC